MSLMPQRLDYPGNDKSASSSNEDKKVKIKTYQKKGKRKKIMGLKVLNVVIREEVVMEKISSM